MKNNLKCIGSSKFIWSWFILLSFTVYSCGSGNGHSESGEPTTTNDSSEGSIDDSDIVEEYGDFFVVIADTGSDYYTLHQLMMNLNRESGMEIDTMGRYYNKEKELIALPDDDEDEMYAGNYFPRRFLSQHLSLEYLNIYVPGAGEKTMGLVAGICETEQEADSIIKKLSVIAPGIFKVKSNLYLGCMH